MSENTAPPPRNLGQESESEFLKDKALQARQAIDRSLEELKGSLRTAADLRLWAQHHPWLTVGAAGVAGFAAGAALTSALQGSAPTETAAPSRESANDPPAAGSSTPQPQPSALWMALAGPMFDLAKFAIQTAISSAMDGAMQPRAASQANQASPTPAQEDVESRMESV